MANNAAPKKAPASSTETTIQAALEPITNMQEQVRDQAEKGLEQVRVQFAAVKEAAEKATGKLEESANIAQAGARELGLKAIDAFRQNINAAFDHAQALFSTKSASDFVSMQSEFLKKQAEVFTGQAKELSALSQKVATEAAEPVKATLVVPFKK